MAWRYLAERLDRSGGVGTIIEEDLPITGAKITDNLSAPGRLSGTIQPELLRLIADDGSGVIDPWSTAIWAEEDGEIRGGGLLTVPGYANEVLSIDCLGMSGYAKDLPFTDSYYGVQVDPLDMARYIWTHIQGKPNGNLGVVLDPTVSPIRIGTALTQVEFDTSSGPVSFEAGPYKLAWWQSFDLGKEFDDLASSTPFDYRDRPAWSADGTHIVKRIELGYPRIGARRTDLRFVVGENVFVVPDSTFDDKYANGVLVLGAGEGRDMIRGEAVGVDDGRVRRVAIVEDKTIRSATAAQSRARLELSKRTGKLDVTDLSLIDHESAPVGAVRSGDDIYLENPFGWGPVSDWFRVLSVTLSPDDGLAMQLSVVRSDKVTT